MVYFQNSSSNFKNYLHSSNKHSHNLKHNMDYQSSYPATPTKDQDNETNLVCPSPPKPCKSSIMFDGMNMVLPFQLSSESDPASSPDDELDEEEVIFSLKPRSSFTHNVLKESLTTKVAIDSIPPPPFGYTQRHEMSRSLTNKKKTSFSSSPKTVCTSKTATHAQCKVCVGIILFVVQNRLFSLSSVKHKFSIIMRITMIEAEHSSILMTSQYTLHTSQLPYNHIQLG